MKKEIESDNLFEEKDHKQLELILLRGMEDLPDAVIGVIGRSLGAIPFNSNWFDEKENLSTKLHRLDQIVDEAKNSGKQVIFIGVSAGAALAMAYMIENPDKIRHVFSLSGLLNIDLKTQDLTHLTKASSSFKEIAEFLDKKLTPKVKNRLHLPDKVSAYSSPEGKDTTVPYSAAQPAWLKKENQRFIGNANNAPDHASAIAQTLLVNIRNQLDQLSEAKFG